MNFKDLLLLKKLGQGILSVTSVLAIILGGWVLMTVFSFEPTDEILGSYSQIETRPPSHDSHQRAANLPTTLDSPLADESGIRRSISSISAIESVPEKAIMRAEEKTETVKLDCIADGSKIMLKSNAKQLRIKTRLCTGQRAAVNVSQMVNRANGYIATLFNLEGSTFSTDYIALDKEPNQIVMNLEDESGARIMAEINISRKD